MGPSYDVPFEELRVHTADGYLLCVARDPRRGGFEVFDGMGRAVARLLVGERVARALVEVAPSLAWDDAVAGLRTAHRADRRGESDAAVRAAFTAPERRRK